MTAEQLQAGSIHRTTESSSLKKLEFEGGRSRGRAKWAWFASSSSSASLAFLLYQGTREGVEAHHLPDICIQESKLPAAGGAGQGGDRSISLSYIAQGGNNLQQGPVSSVGADLRGKSLDLLQHGSIAEHLLCVPQSQVQSIRT